MSGKRKIQKKDNDMVQVIQMTQKEKMAMYMKLSKKELAKMLINCNVIIEGFSMRQNPTVKAFDILKHTGTGHQGGLTDFTYTSNA